MKKIYIMLAGHYSDIFRVQLIPSRAGKFPRRLWERAQVRNILVSILSNRNSLVFNKFYNDTVIS